jgi:hypothetical protein
MAPKKRILSTFVSFDVTYEDGTLSSNRKVPSIALTGLDGDEPAKAVVEEQDRTIALASGRPQGVIKTLSRSAPRPSARE